MHNPSLEQPRQRHCRSGHSNLLQEPSARRCDSPEI